METGLNARLLNVLNIDDQVVDTFRGGQGNAAHFNVDKISRWREAQAVLAGSRQIRPRDLLLLDVSFDKDDDVKEGADISAPTKSGVVPIGPLLALPFLNMKVVMGFSPYSAHIKNSLLKKYPPFLVAMGLIAAKIEGAFLGSEHLSVTKDNNKLDVFIKNLGGAGDTDAALEIALKHYRKNLLNAIKNDRLLLMKSQKIVDAFENWQRDFDGSGGEIEFPTDLGLDVTDLQSNPDCISVVSLFADKLGWVGSWANQDTITYIQNWIDEAAKSELPFAKAINTIEVQDGIGDTALNRPRIDSLINQLYPLSNAEEKREIFRLCVLFANAHAWSIKAPKFKKTDVYTRLGQGVEQNTYRGWFGMRGRNSPSTEPITDLNILPLKPINRSLDVQNINSSFITDGTVLSQEDDFYITCYRKRYSDPRNKRSDYFDYRWECPYSVKDE